MAKKISVGKGLSSVSVVKKESERLRLSKRTKNPFFKVSKHSFLPQTILSRLSSIQQLSYGDFCELVFESTQDVQLQLERMRKAVCRHEEEAKFGSVVRGKQLSINYESPTHQEGFNPFTELDNSLEEFQLL